MKKAGFVLVIVGMLVASLLLLNMTLTPHVGASSEKITAKLANGVVWQQQPCPGGYLLCCSSSGDCVCLPIFPYYQQPILISARALSVAVHYS